MRNFRWLPAPRLARTTAAPLSQHQCKQLITSQPDTVHRPHPVPIVRLILIMVKNSLAAPHHQALPHKPQSSRLRTPYTATPPALSLSPAPAPLQVYPQS